MGKRKENLFVKKKKKDDGKVKIPSCTITEANTYCMVIYYNRQKKGKKKEKKSLYEEVGC